MSWYVAIKMGEAVIWLSCCLFFVWKSIVTRPFAYHLLVLAAAFLIFGLADAVEYVTNGKLPWWLWAWKIAGGLNLFAWLMVDDYMRRGRAALAPYRFIAAGVILLWAIFNMIWAQKVGGF
jgi:hypothetical protein